MTKIVEENDMQGAFNAAYNGLKAQNWMQSLNGGACSYRGRDGRKCAIGHMIPDDQYSEEIEGSGCYKQNVVYACGWEINILSSRFRELLSSLQFTHDKYEGEALKRDLHRLATVYRLQVPE